MEKASLPIKTKIAAWWMIVIGGGTGILSILSSLTGHEDVPFIGLAFGCPVLLFSIPGIFVLRKKKWAYWLAMILSGVLSILIPKVLFDSAVPIFYMIIFGVFEWFIFGVPFILFFLDRKNFWKIAI